MYCINLKGPESLNIHFLQSNNFEDEPFHVWEIYHWSWHYIEGSTHKEGKIILIQTTSAMIESKLQRASFKGFWKKLSHSEIQNQTMIVSIDRTIWQAIVNEAMQI